MSLGDRIREKRKAKGLTLQQLGDVFGITRSSVSEWESGGTRPDPSKLVRLAEVLDTTVDYLLENSDRKRGVIGRLERGIGSTLIDGNVAGTDRPAGKLPVISWTQAGEWGKTVNTISLREAPETVTSPYPGDFVLRVVGDSMFNPGGEISFRDGDLISIDTTREAANRKLVVVKYHGEPVPVFRQMLIESDGTVLLQALNPAWPNRYQAFDALCTLIGVVTGQWREH